MRSRLRRYPALGFLAVAALLASLLPSALRIPLSGRRYRAEDWETSPGDDVLSAEGQPCQGD